MPEQQKKSKPKTAKQELPGDLQQRSLLNPALRTESANAKRFVEAVQERILFVSAWNKWLAWDGKRWKIDDHHTIVRRLAIRWAKRLWAEYGNVRQFLVQRDATQLESFCKASNSDRGIAAMIHLAQSDERVQCDHRELDCKPYLLNVDNGTLDLQTGTFGPHDPQQRITQLAPVVFDPAATCPKWIDTMQLIFQGDPGLIRFVQQVLGYCLSGDIAEHVLPIAVGSGANGKSTVWHVVLSILGDDYAMLANESLLLGDGANHPTDKAALFGKRFVPISEPEKGAKLRESRVKELTGDSMITARRMREDFWSFQRTHKFFLASNHLPKISGTDHGIWRRLKVVPFAVKLSDVAKPIKGYEQLLVREESSGILNWLVAGFRDWQANSFIEPIAVTAATEGYRTDSDPLGEWLADHCIVEPGAVLPASEGFQSFQKWQETQGIPERFRWTQTKFGKELADRFPKEKPTGGFYRKQWIYSGLRVRNSADDDPAESAENTDFFDLPQAAPSTNIDPHEMRFSKSQQINWGQPRAELETGLFSESKPCPKCSTEMVACAAEHGWQNWDCPSCGHVQPERVAP